MYLQTHKECHGWTVGTVVCILVNNTLGTVNIAHQQLCAGTQFIAFYMTVSCI